MKRHAFVACAVLLAALALHAVLSRAVASGDLLAAVLRDRDAAKAAMLAALLAVRLWLLAFAPGWLLYLAARVLITFARARARR